jgi:hypothetical protein
MQTWHMSELLNVDVLPAFVEQLVRTAMPGSRQRRNFWAECAGPLALALRARIIERESMKIAAIRENPLQMQVAS